MITCGSVHKPTESERFHFAVNGAETVKTEPRSREKVVPHWRNADQSRCTLRSVTFLTLSGGEPRLLYAGGRISDCGGKGTRHVLSIDSSCLHTSTYLLYTEANSRHLVSGPSSFSSCLHWRICSVLREGRFAESVGSRPSRSLSYRTLPPYSSHPARSQCLLPPVLAGSCCAMMEAGSGGRRSDRSFSKLPWSMRC
jgi:hypothetical protein